MLAFGVDILFFQGFSKTHTFLHYFTSTSYASLSYTVASRSALQYWQEEEEEEEEEYCTTIVQYLHQNPISFPTAC
jgi:hypothetical protein